MTDRENLFKWANTFLFLFFFFSLSMPSFRLRPYVELLFSLFYGLCLVLFSFLQDVSCFWSQVFFFLCSFFWSGGPVSTVLFLSFSCLGCRIFFLFLELSFLSSFSRSWSAAFFLSLVFGVVVFFFFLVFLLILLRFLSPSITWTSPL